jgi:FtsP/CotA-like multicopper oxidase with cupredoxin domain
MSGYDGVVPGPALQVRRGEEVRVRLVNELPEPTAMHWHGVRLVNAMDGAPALTQAPIAPGESFDYRFIAPDAGTYWYHPSRTARRGLYGVLLVTETQPVDVDRDLTLIFDTAVSAASAAAQQAASFTVNGASNFDIRARVNERLRLRLLNATDRQILALRVEGLRVFVMATDGEPAQPFAAREGRLVLGPGNRLDVFLDCTLAAGATAPVVVEGTPGNAAIARIVCETAPPSRPSPRQDPQTLPANPLPERMDFPGAFRLETGIGQTARLGSEPLFSVKRGRTVLLRFSNPTSENQYIHLHGHHFRLLDALDDGWKPFWLDTLPVAPQGNSRIAFVADNPGKWLLEGLSGTGSDAWFEVT